MCIFYSKAICQFQGRTYFEGERNTVYSSSGVCVLYECKVRRLPGSFRILCYVNGKYFFKMSPFNTFKTFKAKKKFKILIIFQIEILIFFKYVN